MSIDYDALAKIYDILYGSEQRRKHIVIASLIWDSKTVLDAGCGTGMLGDLLPHVYYICLDLSAGMLKRYVEAHRVLGDPLRADMKTPPLRCCFDAVVAVTSLHEAPGAAEKLFQLVRPGGLFIVSVKERLPPPSRPLGAVLVKVVEAGGDIIYVYRRPPLKGDSFDKPCE